MCVWTKTRGSMKAVVLVATPCAKSLHGKGEKWRDYKGASGEKGQARVRRVGFIENTARRHTVRQRGMGTLLMGTILEFASVPLRKMGTDLLGSWWPCQCVLPTLTS